MSGCITRTDGTDPAAAGAAAGAPLAEYNLDFADLANETLVNGVTDTDVGGLGLNWTPQVAAGSTADVLSYVNGVGLRAAIGSGSNTDYSGSAQTASRYEATMADVYTVLSTIAGRVIDVRNQISVFAFYSAINDTGNNFQTVYLAVRGVNGTPTGASGRMKGAFITPSGGLAGVGVISDTATRTITQAYGDINTAGLQLGVSNAQVMFGIWDTDVATTPFRVQLSTAGPLTTEPSKIEDNFLGIAWRRNAGNPWSVDVERIVIQAR